MTIQPDPNAAQRIRDYLDALPDNSAIGSEFAYGDQFLSNTWDQPAYAIVRDDMEVLLAQVATAGCTCYPDPADHEPGRPCALCATCGGDGFHQVGCEVAQ